MIDSKELVSSISKLVEHTRKSLVLGNVFQRLLFLYGFFARKETKRVVTSGHLLAIRRNDVTDQESVEIN
jgi:hypothetical protein